MHSVRRAFVVLFVTFFGGSVAFALLANDPYSGITIIRVVGFAVLAVFGATVGCVPVWLRSKRSPSGTDGDE